MEDGHFDIGISGHDWVTETGADVVEVAELPYAKTGTGVVKMVLAVPTNRRSRPLADIPAGSRITTEFPNCTERVLRALGIPVEVHFSYGATEAKVPELMDALVDLTETGSTLRHNGLQDRRRRARVDHPAAREQRRVGDPEKRHAIEEIRTLLLGVIEARGRVLLSMNVPAARLDAVDRRLPAMKRRPSTSSTVPTTTRSRRWPTRRRSTC